MAIYIAQPSVQSLRWSNWLDKLAGMRKAAAKVGESKVGAFEAKMHLDDLLRQVESGRSFEICRRGKPIARLVPPAQDGTYGKLAEVRNAFRSIRKRVTGRVNIRMLIEAGRRV